jgi:hypothetical protein
VSGATPYEGVLEQILNGTAPDQVKSAAARGALPFPRTGLVRLYVALKNDANEEIRTAAQQSLDGLDPVALNEVLGDGECAPEVLEFFAPRAAKDETLAEQVAFHRASPASALGVLASEGNAKVLDLVMTNQESLIAHPELLDHLSNNPALRADQRGKILELVERAVRIHERARAGEDPAAADGGEVREEDGFVEAAKLLQVDVGELFAASEIVDGEEFEQAEDPEIRNAYQRIITLNTAQKIVLAMRGGREERMILIRDTNKLVSLGVLKNARITEDDIEAISRMRSVSSDVLRDIGQNREWSKNYTIVSTLVSNPRTPQGVSTNFVSRLQNQDLKKLTTSRDVPELIRRMAKRILQTRTQKRR